MDKTCGGYHFSLATAIAAADSLHSAMERTTRTWAVTKHGDTAMSVSLVGDTELVERAMSAVSAMHSAGLLLDELIRLIQSRQSKACPAFAPKEICNDES